MEHLFQWLIFGGALLGLVLAFMAIIALVRINKGELDDWERDFLELPTSLDKNRGPDDGKNTHD